MYTDTYVPGAYLDLAASKPLAKDGASRTMQIEMNGQWMKNKNLALMRPNATWTWTAHNLAFKSMVVPVTKGLDAARGIKKRNVLILDTPRKIQLMREHFPHWLIKDHCVFRAAPDLAFKPIDPPTLELPEQARIHKYREPDWVATACDTAEGKCLVHEAVEGPNGESIVLKYSTPSQRQEQVRKIEMEHAETEKNVETISNLLQLAPFQFLTEKHE